MDSSLQEQLVPTERRRGQSLFVPCASAETEEEGIHTVAEAALPMLTQLALVEWDDVSRYDVSLLSHVLQHFSCLHHVHHPTYQRLVCSFFGLCCLRRSFAKCNGCGNNVAPPQCRVPHLRSLSHCKHCCHQGSAQCIQTLCGYRRAALLPQWLLRLTHWPV